MAEENLNAFDKGHQLAIEEQKVAASKLEQSSKQLEEQKTNYDELSKVYNDKISTLNLSKEIIDNLEDYIQDLSNLGTYIKTVTEFEANYDNKKQTKAELETKLKGKQKENIEELTSLITSLTSEINILNDTITNLKTLISNHKQISTELEKTFKAFAKIQKEYDEINELSKTSSGNNSKYLTFERYVLIGYFENILKHANVRLSKMTDGRFVLYRKEDQSKGSSQKGLELEVFDYETGKKRDVKTLSGGETFKAALSLALGLADAIENKVGHISIETLFIDEGFGTLDDKSLHQAIDILLELNDGTKSIGIISHVQELKDIIPTKLVVTKSTDGSKVKIVS
jgi:exonuclease SbcC